jgi:membrane-bound lytic murein transglycosylase A
MIAVPRYRFVLFLLAALAACSTSVPPVSTGDELTLKPTSFRSILGWDADDHSAALVAFVLSCSEFAQENDGAATGQGELLAPVSVWKGVCRQAELVPPGDRVLAKQFFERAFVPFKASNGGNSTGLFTGYYEAALMGSRTQHRPFVYPIYASPPAGTPTFTREQIDKGALAGNVAAIVYTDDPVQRFFLHIQGSGRIQLDTGETIRVGYAGTNGLPYVSIGKALVDEGQLKKEDVTMPVLRQWLYDHPGDMWRIMWQNSSYIFFREVRAGPIGTEKVPLTPGRSLAVDAHYIPMGMPVFVDTMLPETPGSPITIHRKLMIAQDTGSAIRGPVRGDIFFGAGTAAEQLAGRMKEGGEETLLVPRALALLIKTP